MSAIQSGTPTIRTSEVWLLAPELRWARTFSRLYRLGELALPGDVQGLLRQHPLAPFGSAPPSLTRRRPMSLARIGRRVGPFVLFGHDEGLRHPIRLLAPQAGR